MRVLVCGGREVERADVFTQLDLIHASTPVEVIVENGEGGAPALATSWARVRGVSVWRVPADEKSHGKEAFALRDCRMVRMCKPDVVLVFPGDPDLVTMARAYGVEVRLPRPPGEDPNQVNFLDEAA